MKQTQQSQIIPTGLAIFSMLFGAGNLMYPLRVGMTSHGNFFLGMFGFLLTAVCLPLAGLIGVMLFDGDYRAFFHRLGKILGEISILTIMLITGPIIAIPRIVTLSHIMTAPFLPFAFLQEITLFSSCIFGIIFLGITYLLTVKENRIVDLLGYVVSPLLLISLTIIFIMGFFSPNQPIETTATAWNAFSLNFNRGYETLDLLGAIIFASAILHILRNNMGTTIGSNPRMLATIGLQSGLIGVTLLGLIYAGMGILGLQFGQGLSMVNEGELFRLISLRVLGQHGSIIIAIAVLMACFSTSIALAAVFAEYLRNTIFNRTICYPSSLALGLIASLPLSIFGLEKVLYLTAGPIINIGYPVFITITFCNIAYKLWNFKPILLPTTVVLLGASAKYFIHYFI